MTELYSKTPVQPLSPAGWARIALVSAIALSASLPMAWISLSKLLLFVAGLSALILRRKSKKPVQPLASVQTTVIVLAALSLFSTSLFWTVADLETALLALVKHAKLLEIILLTALIQSQREARLAILVFLGGQTLVLLASWLLVVGVPLRGPVSSLEYGVVFSSYLDQGIMLAVSAAVAWHVRPSLKLPLWMVFPLVAVALADVMLVLRGRTGYVVAFAMLALAMAWHIPKNLRFVTLICVPLTLAIALFQMSSQIQLRVSTIATEIQAYSKNPEAVSSSGWRLNSWTRSLGAIAEQPLRGHGVGGWTATVKRLQGPNAVEVFGKGPASNPHQEYLLWGVELGIAGIAFLILFMMSMARDFRNLPVPVYRAGLSVIVALAIACLFNSTLYDGLIGDYFCVLLGLLAAFGLRHPPETRND